MGVLRRICTDHKVSATAERKSFVEAFVIYLLMNESLKMKDARILNENYHKLQNLPLNKRDKLLKIGKRRNFGEVSNGLNKLCRVQR